MITATTTKKTTKIFKVQRTVRVVFICGFPGIKVRLEKTLIYPQELLYWMFYHLLQCVLILYVLDCQAKHFVNSTSYITNITLIVNQWIAILKIMYYAWDIFWGLCFPSGLLHVVLFLFSCEAGLFNHTVVKFNTHTLTTMAGYVMHVCLFYVCTHLPSTCPVYFCWNQSGAVFPTMPFDNP